MGMGSDRPHSFREGLKVARRILSRNPRLVSDQLVDTESEQIVLAAFRFATGKALNRMDLFLRMDDALPAAAGDKLLEWANLRSEGRILQHLTGFQAFLDHDYEVNSSVLVPRPETEMLVATAVEELEKRGHPPLLGLEVGAGSGAISVELLHSLPQLKMISTELMPEAQAMALRNSQRILGPAETATRLELLPVPRPDQVLEPFSARQGELPADFLISNPPYLIKQGNASSEVNPEVFQFEPHAALFAPEGDPLYFYRKIAEGASGLLKADGLVFVEVPHERADAISLCFEKSGWRVRLLRDLNGRERVLVGTKEGKRG